MCSQPLKLHLHSLLGMKGWGQWGWELYLINPRWGGALYVCVHMCDGAQMGIQLFEKTERLGRRLNKLKLKFASGHRCVH